MDHFHLSLYETELLSVISLSKLSLDALADITSGNQCLEEGKILVDNQEMNLAGAMGKGTETIYCIRWEPLIFPQLTIGENIRLLCPKRMKREEEWEEEIDRWLRKYGITCRPDELAENLSQYHRFLLEFIRAEMLEAQIVLVQDISEVFSEKCEQLLEIYRNFVEKGCSVLILKRNVDQQSRLADRVILVRDGKNVGSFFRGETTDHLLISLLVGKEFPNTQSLSRRQPGEELLKVQYPSPAKRESVSLTVCQYEIVGVCSQMHHIMRQITDALTGRTRDTEIQIQWRGNPRHFSSYRELVRCGIGAIWESDFDKYLFPNMNAEDNLLSVLRSGLWRQDRISGKRGFWENVENVIESNPDELQTISRLSPSQKLRILYERWFLEQIEVLVLINPFTKLNLVLKEEIYRLLDRACARGMGIVIFSNDILEMCKTCNRLYHVESGIMRELSGPADLQWWEQMLHIKES